MLEDGTFDVRTEEAIERLVSDWLPLSEETRAFLTNPSCPAAHDRRLKAS
jgi:hypothetical protein